MFDTALTPEKILEIAELFKANHKSGLNFFGENEIEVWDHNGDREIWTRLPGGAWKLQG